MKKRILVALSAVLVAVMLVATVSAASFDDVKEGDWFYANVQYVADNGLMKGTDKGFEPNKLLSRAELAVMLYNLEVAVYGTPDEVTEASPFTDCDAVASWAGTAIDWAYANGIITGSSATTFSPTVNLNRASMAVMFTRYIKMHGLEDTVDITRVDETVVPVEIFADEFDWVNSGWYDVEVHYVGSVGLITGKPTDNPDMFNFDPEGTASRAEAATVLARLHKFISIPTIGAERAWALFNADYLCSVHGDVQYQYNKLGNNNGNTQATRTPQLLSYDFFIKEIDRVLDYDRDEYYLTLKNRDEFFNTLQAGSSGASANAVLALVRWDGSAEVENTVEVFMEQRIWNNDSVVFPSEGIVLGNWACNDTEENYAEAIQAELDRIFPLFVDYITSSDGKIHINYDANKEYSWVEWISQPLNLAFSSGGFGNGFYFPMTKDLIDDERYMYYDGDGELCTPELKAKKQALLAALNADQTYEYADTLVLTTNTGKTNDSGEWLVDMPHVTQEVTFVWHPVTERTTLMNGGESNIVVDTELKAEEITEFALCDDCGKLHYICSDETITEESLLADFIDMNQVLFSKNKYIVTGLKLDDQFKADLASLGNLEIASGKATFTFKDAYSLTKTLDVEIDVTIQKNTNITKAPEGRDQAKYVATLNVCPDENKGFAAIELEKFIAENTCEECGVIHFNVNKASHSKMSKLQSAIISAMGQRKAERSVFVTTDTKTLVNNTLTDDAMRALLEANGRITKDVTIVYAVSANNDVAMATVTLDIRLDSTYETSIVPTQTLVNEISGEEFVTCPYNLETITAFEESLIIAKVNKIIADKGVDGKYYAWYGAGFKTQGDWDEGNGTPADRVYMFSGAQTAYWTMLRYADFSDCAAQIEDDGDWWHGKFTYDTFEAKGYALGGSELREQADKSLVIDGDTVNLYFETKTTKKVVTIPVTLTIGKDLRVGFHGNTKGDAWAICKSIDEAMATEKAGIQAIIDGIYATYAQDGVITVKINSYNMWHTWRPGTSNRIFFYIPGIEELFKDSGLVTQFQYDGAYLYACMSKADWTEVFHENTGELGSGTLCTARDFTFTIRGAISGATQDYTLKLTYQNDRDWEGTAEIVVPQ
ncbi:MAG: S-layer homology domain-containing protein [Clostridia bacterium]|nr:S-layer homology domain-containing protein [Clostridia bacterium]